MPEPLTPVRVVPANRATWDDVQAVFRRTGSAAACQCQRYQLARGESFGSTSVDERRLRLREQTRAGGVRRAVMRLDFAPEGGRK